jgi:hypothetical protein
MVLAKAGLNTLANRTSSYARLRQYFHVSGNRMKNIAIVFSLWSFLCASCRDYPNRIDNLPNDTTRLFELSIRYGLSDRYMPEASALHIKYRFGDSILLTSDKLSLKLLPSEVDGQYFKKLPFVDFCKMIQNDSLNLTPPNVLVIYDVQKNDTGYSVMLGSRSCRKFGGGGTLNLDFKRVGDSLIVVGRGASSIN